MYLMVDFFFILSGFIMSHVYGDLFVNSATQSGFKKFAFARFARVYPLHLSMLIYTIVLFTVSARLNIPTMPIMQIDNNSYSIFTNLLLLHSMNFHDWFTWVHSSWSISTEWWVYMIFPFLVKPFFRLNTTGKIVAALSCLLGYVVIMLFIVPIAPIPREFAFLKSHASGNSLNVSYQFGFLRCLFGFGLGMVTYQLYRARWNRSVLGNGYVMAAATIFLFISMHFALPDALSACFFPFIILSGAFGSNRINKVFSTKPLQKLGDWSFSIYLIHQPLLFTIGNVCAYYNLKMDLAGGSPGFLMFVGWVVCILFVAILLPLSYLTYEFLEVPARNWLNSKGRARLRWAKA